MFLEEMMGNRNIRLGHKGRIDNYQAVSRVEQQEL